MSIILINKSEEDIKHCFCCKVSVLFVWQYVTHVTIFKAFYILLNSLSDTSKGILFHFRTDFYC